MNNRGFEDFAAETSIMSNNNGSNTFSFSYGPRNGLKFLTFSATALGLSYFYNGILNKDEDFDAFLVLPGIVSALALNEAIWRPYNHQQYKAYSTRLLLDQSPHAHFFCFPASEVVVSQGLFNTQWSGSNRIVSGTVVSDRFSTPQKFSRRTSPAVVDSGHANQKGGERLTSGGKSESHSTFFSERGFLSVGVNVLAAKLEASPIPEEDLEFDYANTIGFRLGSGVQFRLNKTVSFFPEFALQSRNIRYSDSVFDRIVDWGLYAGCQKVVRDSRVSVRGRLGMTSMVSFRRYDVNRTDKLDLINSWERNSLIIHPGTIDFESHSIHILRKKTVVAAAGVGFQIHPRIELSAYFERAMLPELSVESTSWWVGDDAVQRLRMGSVLLGVVFRSSNSNHSGVY